MSVSGVVVGAGCQKEKEKNRDWGIFPLVSSQQSRSFYFVQFLTFFPEVG